MSSASGARALLVLGLRSRPRRSFSSRARSSLSLPSSTTSESVPLSKMPDESSCVPLPKPSPYRSLRSCSILASSRSAPPRRRRPVACVCPHAHTRPARDARPPPHSLAGPAPPCTVPSAAGAAVRHVGAHNAAVSPRMPPLPPPAGARPRTPHARHAHGPRGEETSAPTAHTAVDRHQLLVVEPRGRGGAHSRTHTRTHTHTHTHTHARHGAITCVPAARSHGGRASGQKPRSETRSSPRIARTPPRFCGRDAGSAMDRGSVIK